MVSQLKNEFFTWVSEVLCKIPDDVAAYNFNLYEDDEEGEFLVEIVAISSFSYMDKEWDWMENEIWNSGELMFIMPTDVFEGEWEDFHMLIANLVEDLLKTDLSCMQILKNSEAVSVGFIDGELEVIWKKS